MKETKEYKVIVNNGSEYWNKNGLLHRENGPAVIHSNGKTEYWLNGEIQKQERKENERV